jgi:hypothetical protein
MPAVIPIFEGGPGSGAAPRLRASGPGCRTRRLSCMFMGLSDVTAEAVRAAIAECDDLGRKPFRLRYGFWPSREYELVHVGRRYDSKAIMGVAHRYATGQVLSARQFSGGEHTVARRLRQLGFTVEHLPVGDPAANRQPLVLIAPATGTPLLGHDLQTLSRRRLPSQSRR